MGHEALTINNRLINELFDYLFIMNSEYYPRIPIHTPASASLGFFNVFSISSKSESFSEEMAEGGGGQPRKSHGRLLACSDVRVRLFACFSFVSVSVHIFTFDILYVHLSTFHVFTITFAHVHLVVL